MLVLFLAFQLETKKKAFGNVPIYSKKKYSSTAGGTRNNVVRSVYGGDYSTGFDTQKNDDLAAPPDHVNKEWAIYTRLIAAKSLNSRWRNLWANFAL